LLLGAFLDLDLNDIESEELTDEEIQKIVIKALKSNLGVDFLNVRPIVKDGIVELKGQVADVKSRQQVEDIVRSLPGVRGVDNNLLVDFLLG
ncbi:MAG: BON domain-containing protein, partial [Candidatus Eremiobacteraeota bacterium]|nr:BON domain-containing protein [Candidatus Eremiobacteraeota bacterium]